MRRHPAALLSALFLALAGTGLAALPAEAATVTDGHCSTDTGVTVVVDHQQLGGGIVIKCVEGYPAGASGLEVLHLAGFAPEGTVHDGSSFVCRIAGRPGPNETIAITSDPEYRENCVSTPPHDAFWGYWYAPNGGKWTFSNLGAGNREAIPGGYEGYSFSLNNSSSNNPPPGVKPAHKVSQPAAPEPTQAPAPTTPAPPKPTEAPKPSVEPEPKVERPRLPARTAPPSRPVTPTPTPSPTPTSQSPTPTPTSPSPTVTEPATATPTPSPTPEPEPSTVPASPTPSAVASAPPVDAVIEDGGPPVGTFIGLGTVAALGIGGGIVWWRRRGL